MFPFEEGGAQAGWDDYGAPVRPGDFGAAGLAAGAPTARTAPRPSAPTAHQQHITCLCLDIQRASTEPTETLPVC